MEVITRNLLIADLATIPGELVAKVCPELCIEMEHQVKEKDGSITTKITMVVNWGKILFETNTPKLEFILSHFQRRDLILTDAQKEEMSKKAQDIFTSLAGNPKPKEDDKSAKLEKDWQDAADKAAERKGEGISGIIK